MPRPTHITGPSPAMVVALVALILSLGGGAYALTSLPADSVGTPQLRKSAIVSSKVRNRSLLAIDFKQGELPRGPRGATGATGAAGAVGPAGPEGPPGPQGGQGVQGGQGIPGVDGSRGLMGATGSVGPSFGTTAFGSPSSSTTGCVGGMQAVSTIISPSSTLRLFATGSALVTANGSTAFTARIEVTDGSATLATIALPGTTSLAAGVPVPVVINGVAALSDAPVDLFPGNYVVRLMLTQTAGCPSVITVTSPQVSMILVGTTP